MSTTTEERTCGCGRPVAPDPWENAPRFCAEHQKVFYADEIYGEWLRAHDTMRERLGDVLDSEDDGPLTEPARQMMEDIKRECARWAANVEAASWMAEQEELLVGDRRITPEEAESAHRTLTRAGRLQDAIGVVYKAPELDEGQRWATLAALYEAQDEVSEELARFRGEKPA